MSEFFDEIPIDELLIFDGDELIFDGSDPRTYIVIEPGAGIDELFVTLAADEPTEPEDRDRDQSG
jgi:hypothetical protein